MKTQKQLIRETILVVPVLLFTLVWLVLGLGFQVDFSPSNDYGTSMFFNLILPLLVVGIGEMVYAITLMIEAVTTKGHSWGTKILYGILAWFLTVHFYFVVYLYRAVRFWAKKNNMA